MEVLIVVVLIATIVGIGVPYYKDYVEKQKAVLGITNLRILAESIERYRAIHNQQMPPDGDFRLLDINIPANMLDSSGQHYDDGNFVYIMTDSNTDAYINADRVGAVYTLRYYLDSDEFRCKDAEDWCDKFNIKRD